VPESGTAFLSVNDSDKPRLLSIAKKLTKLGFNLVATKGTHTFLKSNNLYSNQIYKVGEGRPNVVDEILNDNIQIVINSPEGPQSRFDEEAIGKTSVMKNVLTITTMPGAEAAIDSMKHLNKVSVKALQEYFE
jgi:carbamoyl-phosphate synthase large subunit